MSFLLSTVDSRYKELFYKKILLYRPNYENPDCLNYYVFLNFFTPFITKSWFLQSDLSCPSNFVITRVDCKCRCTCTSFCHLYREVTTPQALVTQSDRKEAGKATGCRIINSPDHTLTYLGTPALNQGASVTSLYWMGLPWALLPSWDIPFSMRDVDLWRLRAKVQCIRVHENTPHKKICNGIL